MMLVTTMTPVIMVLSLIYFVLLRKIPQGFAWVSYTVVVIISVLYSFQGSVHFLYMALGNLSFGIFLVWLHYHFWLKPQPYKANLADTKSRATD